MADPQVAPYGSWKSPITSDLIVAETVTMGQAKFDGEDIYWIEQRPSEGGRNVIVRRTSDGKQVDVTPAGFNARTRVHEYGGGAYLVDNGTIYFSNYNDQRLYRQDPGQEPRPLTPAVDMRYADAAIDHARNRLILVREDHTGQGEAVNTLVGLDVNGDETGGQVLVSGNNFYSTPRVSPNGKWLAWLTWNHPNMPWDGTELWIGQIEADGRLGSQQRVAGGPEESIFQPEWSPSGVLCFVSDRTGWWNLYRLRDGVPVPLHKMEAEFGVPQWVFGESMYGFDSPERIVTLYHQGGATHLAVLDTNTGQLTEVPTPYVEMEDIAVAPGQVLLMAGTPTEAWALVLLDLATGNREVLRRTTTVEVDPGYISAAETIEFPTENGLTAFAFYYPPRNKDYLPPEGEKPPLIVMSHGGPTGSTSSSLRLATQYWTSRGFAALDVNYGGSTGYGTAYRKRLNGQWGVIDVDDCVNGARFLVEKGLVDPNRLAIRGGSAGGYTTLCAITFKDTFRAGASHFGISDLEVFVHDTHKFESRYLDRLVGPFPERADLYRDRSAMHHLDQMSTPVIFFQGLEDMIVPPNQAEIMVDALKAKGVPVAYLPFEGEQHGFRRAENIKRSLDAELYFYSRVFGFQTADPIEPLEIANM